MNKNFNEDIQKKIKYIKVRTKRILSGTLIGDHSTALKGTGHEFDQLREYQVGDDVRFVDWKSSARNGKILIKQYFEERNRDIIIAIDISSSTLFTSGNLSKSDIIAQISCVLTIVSDYTKDNIGILFFSDKIIEFIKPLQGKFHVAKVMKKIMEKKVESSKTDINLALGHLIKNLNKKSIIFFLSDFIDENDFERNLKIISKKHEVIAIKCLDKLELNLPEIGIIHMRDFESGQDIIINLNRKNFKNANSTVVNYFEELKKVFKRSNVKFMQINTQKDFFYELIGCFRKLMY